MKRLEKFQSDHQSFFQLASIQSASLGISVIIIGKTLAKQYGAGTTICSIALGNLILWLVGITIISMVDRVHSSAIDNFKSYLGKYGGLLTAGILMVAFLGWYAFQINSSITEIDRLFKCEGNLQKSTMIRLGAVFGVISSTLSIGGIRLLRKITVIVLPLLVVYHFYAISTSGISVPLKGTWGLSFQAIVIAILTLLPGVINFPTFFRHSRSKAHSFLALTLVTVFITFFEVSTIWMGFSDSQCLSYTLVAITLFVSVILTTCNLLNIYLASACWEAIVPRFGGPKGFAIVGMLGTLVFTFVQISTPVQFIQDLTNAYISCLGIVLLMAYLLRIIIRHRPRPFEKIINMSVWLFGCLIATIYEIQHFLQGVPALLAGINASILFFLCIVFIEESVWALRKKFINKALKS